MNGVVLTIALTIIYSTHAFEPEKVRVLETTPKIARMLIENFPDQIQKVNESTLLSPEDLVPELSRQVHRHTGRCGGFVDVTHEPLREIMAPSIKDPFPPLKEKQVAITQALEAVKGANIESFVKVYSNKFSTRYARSEEGSQAPIWLRDQWQKMADHFGRSDITVELMAPPEGYTQNSVRIQIPGRDRNLPRIILGAHLDSINQRDGGVAPGADDDGSGIGALTEVYRVLLLKKFVPEATIEIFGYAAEELGLLGSRAIAQKYAQDKIPVRAVLQLDMVAFPAKTEMVTFIDDNVDPNLNLWTEQLYGLYLAGRTQHDRCGYACSDHASWNRYHYSSVIPFETMVDEMNDRIHSSEDTWDQFLNADYAAIFSKIALAFVVELSRAR